MQLRPGYKQTDVGVIPDDWDVDSIANLAAITTGDKNTQDRVDDGTYPFFVRSSTIQRINSYTFDGEAVLTAGDGVGTGKIFHYINGKFDSHQRVYKISHFDDRLNGYFFYLYFSNNFYSRMMQMTAKSSVDSVRREMIANMQVPVPPPLEQRAIAGALSDVDAMISGLEQLIAKKRDIKQAAMQQLLTGQTRLPGLNGHWVVRRLGDISSIGRGRVISHREINASRTKQYPVYSSQTTKNGIMGWIDTHDFEGEYITWTTDGEKAGTPFHRTGKFNCTNVCGTIKLKKDNALFMMHVLQREMGRYVSRNLANPKLMNDVVKRIEIVVPENLAEQTAIANVLSDMDAELAALELRRDKTRDLKQGMMQELLTGRIRLI